MNTAALEPPEIHFIHGIRCVFTVLITFGDIGSPDSMGRENIWVDESNHQSILRDSVMPDRWSHLFCSWISTSKITQQSWCACIIWILGDQWFSQILHEITNISIHWSLRIPWAACPILVHISSHPTLSACDIRFLESAICRRNSSARGEMPKGRETGWLSC